MGNINNKQVVGQIVEIVYGEIQCKSDWYDIEIQSGVKIKTYLHLRHDAKTINSGVLCFSK